MNTPMWRGWNSLTVVDTLPMQNIGIMQNICASPTRLDVVHLTMLTGYDLAISKPAYRIQDLESPKFDKLFIETGHFHGELAFYPGVGYYITGSGLDEILVTSGIIGSGSLAGFLEGRHYNRCIVNHPKCYAALSKIHMNAFHKSNYDGQMPEHVKEVLDELEGEISEDAVEEILSDENSDVLLYIQRYEQFCEKTRAGDLGLTGRYWMVYMDMISKSLMSQRAVRTNDVELYTYCLGQFLPVYWAANRSNYKRWGVKNYLQ